MLRFAGIRAELHKLVGALARFSYSAHDDVSATSYDVSVRTASSGKAMGSWRAPAAWQRISGRSVSVPMAAGA